ncbi:MAG: DUF4340 domain-containing protein [Gammaproteobacteria bacterium]
MRSRLFSLSTAIAALAFLCWMFVAGKLPTHENRIESVVSGILRTEPQLIVAVELAAGDKHANFTKSDAVWHDAPTQTALSWEGQEALNEAVKFMYTAPPVRVLSPEATAGVDGKSYGLDPPQFRVRLVSKNGDQFTASFGNIGNDGVSQYMAVAGSAETYLMSGFVGQAWREFVSSSLTQIGERKRK